MIFGSNGPALLAVTMSALFSAALATAGEPQDCFAAPPVVAGVGACFRLAAADPPPAREARAAASSVAADEVLRPFDPRDNVMEFSSRASLAAFYRKWSAARPARIVIAHFGDSLIQSGWMPSAARARLQEARGDGGRGMIFPYAIAKTYDQDDYRSSFTGAWQTANSIQQPPRLPVGISGFVARTSDATASFTFAFKQPLGRGPKRIRILYRSPGAPYRLTVSSGAASRTAELAQDFSSAPTRLLDLRFDSLADVVSFDLSRPADEGGAFELYGVSIENASPGLIYHNLGVGGATFSALNQQMLFREQASMIDPDLVVLDWGTNDVLYKNSVPANHEAVVRRTIAKVRSAYPDAAIVVTSAQDLNFRGQNITATRQYSNLMRRVALESGCLFYDWYRVAGGEGAMARWFSNGLASRDNIHLNGRGYRLKGTLFANALINTLTRYGDRRTSSLILPPVAGQRTRPPVMP